MPDHKTVYLSEADSYDRLVSCEDFEGNILKNIEQVSTLVQKDVVEFGAGTGRLTTLLAPLVRSIQAFDSSSAMLEIAEKKLRIFPNKNWRLQQADNRSIPVPDHCADIVVSGWSICYFVSWSGSEWIQDIKKSLSEMKRILRTGGKIILLETMGTGFELPTPPLHLHEYYQLLTFYGFKSDWFRTDYKFASLPEAVDLVKFFFGDELAGEVEDKGRLILPECTGIWWIESKDLLYPEDPEVVN
jgi:ubiquinone/menaquinone biosynthesis C-methylase UbiE